MTCDSCGAENRPGSHFCEDCGAPLPGGVCPGCGARTNPGKPFCGACGARVPDGPDPGRPSDPVGPARALAHLSIVVGEDHRDRAIGILARNGAHIDDRGGGRLIASVAAAVPADALGRAARCALQLQRAVAAADGARGASIGLGLDPAVAEELSRQARHGEVLVGADAARLVEPWVRLRLADRRGPGADAEVYAIVDAGPRRSPAEGLAPRLLSPFVGRRRELGVIGRAIDDAHGGRGAAIALVGEPGIGKSRLVFEARRRLPATRVTYLEGRCAPYARAVPLLPVLDILRDNCGIGADDAQSTIASKVATALGELGIPHDDAAPYILRMLGLTEAASVLDGISAEAIRARTLQVLHRMAVLGSRRRTLVLVIEDLHWIDRTSEEFIEGLMPALPEHRLLLVLTYRSGHTPAWPRHEGLTELRLAPLPEEDASRIVQRAIGSRSVQPAVIGAILDRADGNPLHLEELGRSVREGSRSDQAPAVPSSLGDLLEARLDRLPGEPRRLLQTCAVIGRRIDPGLLGALAGPEEDWADALDQLVRQEFVHAEGDHTGAALVFNHVLVQDTAYRSIPAGRRRALHAEVAEALSRRAGGRDDEILEELAHHWSKAERPREAVEHLRRAADRSAEGYAHEEADRTLQRAMTHAEGLPEAEREASLVDLAVRRARSLYFLGEVRSSLGILTRLEARAERAGDGRRLSELRFWIAHAHSHLGHPSEAGAAARESVALAERAGEASVIGRARYVLAREGWWTGRFRDGIAAGEAAVPVLEEAGQAWWLGHCLCYIGHGHQSLGRFDAALEAVARAREIGEATGDPRIRSFAAWSRGWYLASMGRPEEGIPACEEAIAVSPDRANSAWALGFLGFAHRESGEPDRAIDELGRAIDAVRAAHHPRVLCWFEGWLADAHLAAGRPHPARAAARSALTTARRVGCPWAAAYATRSLARIALAEGADREAAAHLATAAGSYARLGADFEHAVTLIDAARCARLQGDHQAAGSHAAQAGRLLAPLPVPRWRRRAEEAMAPTPP